MSGLFIAARQCLDACEPDDKLALTRAAVRAWRDGQLAFTEAPAPENACTAGRPARPLLVSPKELAHRSAGSALGRAALLHAVAHIEFNAINLAWDAVYRFRGMPAGYYADWVRIANEEAYHFDLVRGHLRSLGCEYGDFPAHNGLWEMAVDTAHDVMVRMALVPRVLEARGLDVTPGMMARLEASGDAEAVKILEVILRDEIGHVAAGTRWFRHCCAQRGLDPDATFMDLLERHMRGRIKGPLHRVARQMAGFNDNELQLLEAMVK